MTDSGRGAAQGVAGKRNRDKHHRRRERTLRVCEGLRVQRGRQPEELLIWRLWQISGLRGVGCVVLGPEGRCSAEVRPNSLGI